MENSIQNTKIANKLEIFPNAPDTISSPTAHKYLSLLIILKISPLFQDKPNKIRNYIGDVEVIILGEDNEGDDDANDDNNGDGDHLVHYS